jgi:CCR4-NOT transcription complex subunit 9
MQHAVFPHQQYPDWQHHQPHQTHHQYAQSQAAAAAANAAAQQQHYRGMNQNGGITNGNGAGQGLVDGRDHPEHGPGSMIPAGDAQISEENRKVLEWIAQVLNPNTREAALLELSKKREQVPELALILWHSFGEDILVYVGGMEMLTGSRRHDVPLTGDHIRLPASEPVATHRGGL